MQALPHYLYANNKDWDINCGRCKKWWAIPREDWEEDNKRYIYCPFCGNLERTVRKN